jgi:hypothetical protein
VSEQPILDLQAAAGEASYPVTSNWSIEQLLALTRDEVVEIWGKLPSATLEELQGHFMGVIPNAGDSERQAGTAEFMYNEYSERGYWLGKAYRKIGPNEGEGYNRWRFPGGKVVRNGRFATEVGKSLLDQGESLLMYYGAFNDKSTLVDEIRKLDDYIYLGMGAVLDEKGNRSEPGHFVLVGPTDEWVGGAIGDPVEDFVKPTK